MLKGEKKGYSKCKYKNIMFDIHKSDEERPHKYFQNLTAVFLQVLVYKTH